MLKFRKYNSVLAMIFMIIQSLIKLIGIIETPVNNHALLIIKLSSLTTVPLKYILINYTKELTKILEQTDGFEDLHLLY